ncbi:MAG TPA: FAD-binding oxidoreductase [Bryobacteraceae bacterium]|nr:FAD-binding oxidoreductase [Bryobacteraceae bacterium]
MPDLLSSVPTAAALEGYVRDASGFSGHADAVFVPRDEGQVIEILHRAVRERMPVTVVGARSGLTGGGVARGGWAVSLESFRRIDISDGLARVGAGVALMELQAAAARTGQFYPPDPTEITASVGGSIATNASGSRSFLYGSTRRHVRELRVALMDGSVREYRCGERIDFPVPEIPWPATTKCTAGYPLAPGMEFVDLFCGSEGTLGIVLEAGLQLLPMPKELFSAVVFFRSDADTLDAVDAWRPIAGLRMLEYVDRNALDLIHARFPDIPAEAGGALLIEAEGAADLEAWDERLSRAGALAELSWFAVSAADRERFRKLRHTLPEMVNETVLRRGFLKMGTDYAVPIARNREMLTFYKQRLDAELNGKYVLYGHIGDAHVHVQMLPASAEDAEVATALLKEFAAQAVALGGTVSAEHGLGKRKAHLLKLQYSAESIESMMAVKRRFDPEWLLGRDTLFAAPA